MRLAATASGGDRGLRGSMVPVLLVATVLGGCAAGGRFAPVDEVGIGASRGSPLPAPASGAVTAGDGAPTGGGSAGVQVLTIPDDGAAAGRPLEEGASLRSDTAPPAPLGASPAPATPAVAALEAPSSASAPAPASLSPAVVALVNDANRRAHAGEHDRAAASIERALQVEPGNAWLWHRLARERLAQGRASEAESLAGRSNSLAAGDPRLQAGNWRLIEQARRQRGDLGGADEAARRASALGTG